MIMSRKQREYSYDDWKKAMDLHNKYKLGYIRISRILGINENTVNKWLYKGVVPPAAKWVAKPSKELAYILGISHGDGNITKNEANHEYIIQVGVIDKEFAEMFSKVMAKLLDTSYHKPRWNEKEKKWRVRYKSKAFYLWYKKCEEKGLEGFKKFIEYNKQTVKYYLKGLYDSDGYNYRNRKIHLGNTNIELLEYVQYLLKKYFNIKSTGPYLNKKAGTKTIINGVKTTTKHNCYYISITRKLHVEKFLEEIGFSIVRRQLGLKKHEKVFVEGKHVEPYRLVELGLFKLPFNQ